MIRLRSTARDDIRAAIAYLEEESANPSIRRRFLASFEESCVSYERWPRMGVRVDLEKPGEPPLRRFAIRRFPNYLVFYRESKGGILVERVVHGAQDIPLLLNG